MATAGGDDRKDRHIRLYNLKTTQLMAQLDNKTGKPVTTLRFHPIQSHLLVSADLEFDLKVWDWREGSMMVHWKKHHSRVIHKVDFVPGEEFRLVSCSSDNTLKIKAMSDEGSGSSVQSIHANEPITSFVFHGPPEECKLMVTLAHTIRIYKVRTLQLLQTITFNDLKVSRMPIRSIEVHPQRSELMLLSVENTLQLIDLNEQPVRIVRQFNARELIPGVIRVDFGGADANET